MRMDSWKNSHLQPTQGTRHHLEKQHVQKAHRQKVFTCYSSAHMHILNRQTGRSKERKMQRIQLEKTSPLWEGKKGSLKQTCWGKGTQLAKESHCPLLPDWFSEGKKKKSEFCMLLKFKYNCLREGLFPLPFLLVSLQPGIHTWWCSHPSGISMDSEHPHKQEDPQAKLRLWGPCTCRLSTWLLCSPHALC